VKTCTGTNEAIKERQINHEEGFFLGIQSELSYAP